MAEGEGDTPNDIKEDKDPNLNKQILRQIEYYFGDISLPRDKFLQEQIKLENGWVPLEIMLKFKRLASITTDCDAIVAALGDSSLMEVSEDKKKIRRNPDCPLPVFNEERRKELLTRTVYCKGFPVEETTLDNLLEYFNKFGPIDNVQMRTYKDKATEKYIFKGSVFVIFKTKELAENYLKEDTKYQDIELIRKWQSDYIEDKRKERQEKKLNAKKPANNAKQEYEKKEELPKGAILHLTGINAETTREDIKGALISEGLDVAFIDFKKEDDFAWVRLLGENSSKGFVEKLKDRKFEICGSEIKARSLEGDEETEFLQKTKEDMEKRRQQNLQSKKGRRGGKGGDRGRGRGGFFGKRKGSPVRGEPSKKQAVETKSDNAGETEKSE